MNVVKISSPLTKMFRPILKFGGLICLLGFIILTIAFDFYLLLFIALAFTIPIYLFTKYHTYINVVDVHLDSNDQVIVFENLETNRLEARYFAEVIKIERWLNSQLCKVVFRDGTQVPFILFNWMISIKEVRAIVEGDAEVKDFKFQEG